MQSICNQLCITEYKVSVYCKGQIQISVAISFFYSLYYILGLHNFIGKHNKQMLSQGENCIFRQKLLNYLIKLKVKERNFSWTHNLLNVIKTLQFSSKPAKAHLYESWHGFLEAKNVISGPFHAEKRAFQEYNVQTKVSRIHINHNAFLLDQEIRILKCRPCDFIHMLPISYPDFIQILSG